MFMKNVVISTPPLVLSLLQVGKKVRYISLKKTAAGKARVY